MGHSWREMDPEGAAAFDYYWDAVSKLRKQLDEIPLSAFMASDFGAIGRVTVPGSSNPTEDDMKLLRKRIKAWKKANKSS